MARRVKRLGWGGMVLAVVVAVGVGWLAPFGDRTEAEGAVTLADSAVRVLTAGPIRMDLGTLAESRLLLPAVQGAMARVWVLDGDGNILHIADYRYTTPPAAGELLRAFHRLAFDLWVEDEQIVFGDGSVRTAIDKYTENNEVAILIGLLLPAVQKVREAAKRAELGTLRIETTDPETGRAEGSQYLSYTLENVLISSYS